MVHLSYRVRGISKQIKQSSSQAVLDQKDTYAGRRDHHKVQQMLEKSREKSSNPMLVRDITPVKQNKTMDKSKSTGGKTNPMAEGYFKAYAKRKSVAESKSRAKTGRYIRSHHASKTASSRSKSAVSKNQNKSMNNGSNGSATRVIDLKEIRNKEKQKKQAKIGCFGTQYDRIFSNQNFSQMNRNYGINISNLKSQDDNDN